jgi:hypothetical protein
MEEQMVNPTQGCAARLELAERSLVARQDVLKDEAAMAPGQFPGRAG